MGRLLEKEMVRVLGGGLHDTRLVPWREKVELPPQLDFFDPYFGMNEKERMQGNLMNLNATGIRKYANVVTLATYYELLTAGFYGGQLFNHLYVLTRDGEVVRRNNVPSLNGLLRYEELITFAKPDIIDQNSHRITEVKAFRSGKPYKLRDGQIEGYVTLQKTMPLETSIEFTIYRHTIRDFPPTPKHPGQRYDDEELFGALTQHTAHSIVIPFNLVYLLHSISDDSPWVYRDDGVNKKTQLQTRDPGTCLRSQSANNILINPEKFLEDHGLNLEEYDIERLRSPDNFTFGCFSVQPFPITRIRYKNYASWAAKLRQLSPSIPVETPQEPDILDDGEERVVVSGQQLDDENTPF